MGSNGCEMGIKWMPNGLKWAQMGVKWVSRIEGKMVPTKFIKSNDKISIFSKNARKYCIFYTTKIAQGVLVRHFSTHFDGAVGATF
jgi:hypothetical protein